MNCNELHAVLDAELSEVPPPDARAHLNGCAACRQAWTLAHAAREVLRTLPEPPVPPGLAERVLAFTRSDDKPRAPVLRAWSLAIAAAVLLGIGIGVLLTWAVAARAPGYRVQDGTILVPAGTVTVVRVALDTARPLQDVGFVVKIPAGMQLQGHPGEQQIAWRGELAQGRNVLNLALLAAPGAAGTLETDLHYADRSSALKMHVVAVEGASLRGLLHRLLARVRLG